MPVSPGSIALLRPHASLPAVQERWREAATHESPAVRAAAARMIHVAAVRSTLPALIRALETERDEGAAIEQVLAILVIGEPGQVESAASAAARLGGQVSAVFLSTLARVRPEEVLTRASQVSASLDDTAFGTALALAARVPAADGRALASAAAARGLTSWAVFLKEARWLGLAPSPVWIEVVAASGNPRLVDELGWALAVRGATDDGAARAALESDSAPGAWAAPASGLTPSMTLARRIAGDRRARAADLVAGLDDEQMHDVAWRVDEHRLAKHLTDHERERLEGRLGRAFDRPFRRPSSRTSASADRSVESPRTTVSPRVASFGPYPPDLVADLIKVTGCVPGSDGISATVAFHDDGRPSKVELSTGGVSVECQRVLQALATSSLLPPSETARQVPVLLVTSLASPAATCEGTYVPAVARYAGRPMWRREVVTSPVRTRDVEPVVPPESRRQGIQGVIIGSLVVSGSGCVSSVEVHRRIPTLDIAAIANVQQWRFAPAEAGGTRVPATLTWLVNFMY